LVVRFWWRLFWDVFFCKKKYFKNNFKKVLQNKKIRCTFALPKRGIG
jgi:hypothetical protein